MSNVQRRTEVIEMAIECMQNKRFYSGDIVWGANALQVGDADRIEVDFHHVSPVLRDMRVAGKIVLVEHRKTRHYYVRAEDVLNEGLKAPSMVRPTTVCNALQVELGDHKVPHRLLKYMRSLCTCMPDELAELKGKARLVDKLQQKCNDLNLRVGETDKKDAVWKLEAKERIRKAESKIEQLQKRLDAILDVAKG